VFEPITSRDKTAAIAPRGTPRIDTWRPRLAALLVFFLALVTAASTAQTPTTGAQVAHEFYFTRGNYGGESGDWGPRWAIDYPKADQQFLVALRRLSVVDAYPSDHALEIERDSLRDFPFLYMLEVGSLDLSEEKIEKLRNYLLAGGFLVIDDFWGRWEWETFDDQMRLVLPHHDIVDIPLDHPVFHAFYEMREIVQVPNVFQGSTGQPTHEYDGYVPRVRGIFDRDGRLMVLINWNTDLGDAWEWADNPQYPLRFSTYAYEMGINFVIYAMSF
jgi:hypothetical protein